MVIMFVTCGFVILCFFFFKQKTAYEMRISDWSSDVCSSDLEVGEADSARPLGWIVENTAIRRASLDGALALAEGAGAKIDLRAPGDIVEVTLHSGGDRKSVV